MCVLMGIFLAPPPPFSSLYSFFLLSSLLSFSLHFSHLFYLLFAPFYSSQKFYSYAETFGVCCHLTLAKSWKALACVTDSGPNSTWLSSSRFYHSWSRFCASSFKPLKREEQSSSALVRCPPLFQLAVVTETDHPGKTQPLGPNHSKNSGVGRGSSQNGVWVHQYTSMFISIPHSLRIMLKKT